MAIGSSSITWDLNIPAGGKLWVYIGAPLPHPSVMVCLKNDLKQKGASDNVTVDRMEEENRGPHVTRAGR